jgi:hypothetical protein
VATDPNIDPLDERLRQAAKALDGQVSDRYFEALPDRILARLEETMQSDVTRPHLKQPPVTAPVSAAADQTAKTEHQEDSGLHDIRALAQTTKQRMSQRRIPTQNPPVDDSVHTSSASLRAVALPEPGRMVAVEAPPILGSGTGSAPIMPAPAREAQSEAREATAAAASTASVVSSAAHALSPISPLKSRSKAPMIITASVFAVAAAAVVGYTALGKKDAADQAATGQAAVKNEPTAAKAETRSAAAPAVAPAAAAAAPTDLEVEAGAAAGTGAALGLGADDDGGDDASDVKRDRAKDRDKGKKDGDKKDGDKKLAPEPTETKAPTTPVDPQPTPTNKQQEQSLDDLLRGAGVDPDANKKKEAPKLEKKGLDAGDIRKAMSALNGKAQGCYAKLGVSGSVAVKLTVAPSGEVTSAKTTGSFAGTPTGDCVAGVAKAAKFPAWDGTTMTVNYSYFLTE